MTNYYLDWKHGNDGNDGSSARPFKTFAWANGAAVPGDMVYVRGDENDPTTHYLETVGASKSRVVWKAEDGHTPVVNGRYDESLFYQSGGKQWLPGPNESGAALAAKWKATRPGTKGAFGELVNITGAAVVWWGIDVLNASGDGMHIGASDVLLLDSDIDFCYSACLMVDGGSMATRIRNVTVEGCEFSRSSMKFFNRNRGAEGESGGPALVTGCVKVLHAIGTIIRGCTIAYTKGEGYGIAKGSDLTLVEDCIAYNTEHVGGYITKAASRATFRRCFIFQTLHPMAIGESGENQGKPGDCFSIGDETAGADGYPSNGAHAIHNCIGIGGANLLWVRNNRDSYDTQLDGTYIGNNTLEAGEGTLFCVRINDNLQGHPHTAANVFRDNIILSNRHTSADIATAAEQFGKGQIGHNIWSAAPHATMRGEGDLYSTAATPAGQTQFAAGLLERPFGGFRVGQGKWGRPRDDDEIDVEAIKNGMRLLATADIAIGKASAREVPAGLDVAIPEQIDIDAWGNERMETNQTAALASRADIGGNEFQAEEPQEPPAPVHDLTLGYDEATHTWTAACGGQTVSLVLEPPVEQPPAELTMEWDAEAGIVTATCGDQVKTALVTAYMSLSVSIS